MNKLTESMVPSARQVAEALGARAIVFDSEVFDSREDLLEVLAELCYATVLTTRAKPAVTDGDGLTKTRLLVVPSVPMSRTGQVKLAVLVAVAEKVLERGDLVVCLSGVHASNRLDMMTVIKVGDEPEFFVTDEQHPLPPDVDPGVFERILSIASELAVEGREGRQIGALFVIGDSDTVLEHSRQLVINPFHGYPEEERNVLSGNLDETIKEFAAIDGAFIVRGDGVVLSAGRYLIPQGKSVESVRSGLGARHEAAAAITRVTDAVAVALSQSTSTITVFNSGRILTEIERVKGTSQGLRFKRLVDGID